MPAGAAHKGNAVAVGGVHIGLNFEHHAAELGLGGRHHALNRRLGAGRGRQVDQRVEHLAHAKVVDGRAKQHGRLLAVQKRLHLKRGRCAFHQLQLVFGLRPFHTKAFGALGVVQPHQHFFIATHAVGAGVVDAHLVAAAVIHPVEQLAHAHGPSERHHRHAQLALHLVHHVEGRLHLAVHLIDKREDGRVARTAHLQQAAGLWLHTVGRVNHHQRRVHGGEHPVGVFTKVLVAGRVEQIDHAVAVFHLHDRRRHGDAALLFNLHPVRRGVASGLARLDRAGNVDGPRKQQQLFGERGFTRVGVRDDGKRAATAHFRGNIRHSLRLSPPWPSQRQ